MRGIRIVDLETGEEKLFPQAKYAAEYLKISDRNLSYQLRDKRSGKPYKNRYVIEYATVSKPDEPDLKDIIKSIDRYDMTQKIGIWKASQSKQFPNVLVTETVLPFYNKHYFYLINQATKAFFGNKEYLIWYDDVKPLQQNWERQFCKMQIFFKFNSNASFQSKIDRRKIFLFKLQELIKGLNELKKEDELDEIYRRTIEDGIA